ncbi:hypothetical protein GCM10022216_26160 [Sphingobacterium kyonggiense]|uniref:Uncharacterized protein n=1 Tax=Sphingobacterium kyonggiense TaxID=714075 RepID=A0ABP7YZ60_9SPHI
MEKKLSFKIRQESIEMFFPKFRIKNKLHIIKILFEACRYILFEDLTNKLEENMLILNVDKMSRLFFISDNKTYSIHFPFTINISPIERKIYYKNILPIDARLISDIISIIHEPKFYSEDYFDFAESFSDIDDIYLGKTWPLLKDLLIFEDGYLRLDRDLDTFLKAKAEGKEHMHPENHIDIFYTSGNTFKIGLTKNVKHKFFIDLLNVKTDCIYLKY